MTLIDKAEARWPVRGYAPGAYSCKCRKCGQAFIGDKRAYQCQDCVIQDRAAIPARGVGVKPLVWEAREDIAGLHNAGSPIGWWFNVHEMADGRFKYEGDPAIGLNATPTVYPTLEAAKAAAQADYEARILAALAPTDAAQARETHLREAAAAVRARYMGDNNREDMEVLRCEAAILALIGETRT